MKELISVESISLSSSPEVKACNTCLLRKAFINLISSIKADCAKLDKLTKLNIKKTVIFFTINK